MHSRDARRTTHVLKYNTMSSNSSAALVLCCAKTDFRKSMRMRASTGRLHWILRNARPTPRSVQQSRNVFTGLTVRKHGLTVPKRGLTVSKRGLTVRRHATYVMSNTFLSLTTSCQSSLERSSRKFSFRRSMDLRECAQIFRRRYFKLRHKPSVDVDYHQFCETAYDDHHRYQQF
jgi:hypothetical protein